MADSKKIKNITVGGNTYILGSGGGGDIYEELGITQERFIELLDRDFYVPDRSTAPIETTLTYTDTDGSECDYRIGQMCRVPDSDADEGYAFYMLYDITPEGKAVWAQGGGGGGGDMREKVRISLSSNQAQPDSSLIGATVVVTDTTLNQEVLNTTWQGQELLAKVTALSDYTVTVGEVEGYATPAAQSYTASIQGDRSVSFVYNACAVTVTLGSNQADKTDIASAKATVSYGDKSVETASGGTVKVPMGASVTVSASAVPGYATPAPQTFTANAASKELSFVYNTCILSLSFATNQSVHADVANTKASVVSASVNTELSAGQTVKIPYGESVTVTPQAVERYATPQAQTFTADSASKELAFTYNTCVLTVGISGLKDGDTAQATVSYEGGTDQTVASGASCKVPYGLAVTVSVPDVSGYGKPDAQTFTPSTATYSVSMVYVDSLLRVTIDSNQTDKSDLAGLKATVSWSGQSGVQVASGESVAIPVNQQVTITFPDLAGYRKPDSITLTNTGGLVEKTGTYETTVLTLTVTSNQTDKSDVASAYGAVSAGGTSYGNLTNGQSVKIPTGSSVTVTFSDVTGYRKPSALSFTATGVSVSKTGTYQTELVTVAVNADDSSSVNGQKVTVNGTVYTYSGSTITQKVPFGSSYSVSVDAKSGYTAPAQQSFTANQASRAVTMTYVKIKLGVFILHTDGNLYTADQWNTAWNANAVGVAVLTNEKKFVIAPTDSGSTKQIYNDYFTYPDLPQIGSESSAKADLNGETNTPKMTAVYGTSNTYAAGYCASYTFKNGKKGYLPSLGEWWIAYNNKAAIDTAMSKCGGTAINTSYYHWSSTRYTNDSNDWCFFWGLRWDDGNVPSRRGYVPYRAYVRAFSAF